MVRGLAEGRGKALSVPGADAHHAILAATNGLLYALLDHAHHVFGRIEVGAHRELGDEGHLFLVLLGHEFHARRRYEKESRNDCNRRIGDHAPTMIERPADSAGIKVFQATNRFSLQAKTVLRNAAGPCDAW